MGHEKILTFIAIASLVLGIYNSWAIQNPPNSADLVNQGNSYFNVGNYKKAINCYEKALKLHSSYGTYASALKYEGFALFNLGLNNESMDIQLNNESFSNQAVKLIEYYNSSFYLPTEANRNYFENSYQYLKDATTNSPNDLEALLYTGIASLYLSPSSSYDPLAEFDNGLKALDNLAYIQKSPQANSIKSALWLGKAVAYLKIGALEDADTCLRNARSISYNLSLPQNHTTSRPSNFPNT
jgi:tetratricopeptide (TPR) repeat protein